MVTALGKYLRKLRIDKGEVLFDMARKLNVSPSFLSAVENGNKRMPPKWNEFLPSLYSLSASDMEEFTAAIAESESGIAIDFRPLGMEQRRLGVALARKIPTLTPEQTRELQALLFDEVQSGAALGKDNNRR